MTPFQIGKAIHDARHGNLKAAALQQARDSSRCLYCTRKTARGYPRITCEPCLAELIAILDREADKPVPVDPEIGALVQRYGG